MGLSKNTSYPARWERDRVSIRALVRIILIATRSHIMPCCHVDLAIAKGTLAKGGGLNYRYILLPAGRKFLTSSPNLSPFTVPPSLKGRSIFISHRGISGSTLCSVPDGTLRGKDGYGATRLGRMEGYDPWRDCHYEHQLYKLSQEDTGGATCPFGTGCYHVCRCGREEGCVQRGRCERRDGCKAVLKR